jgi:hypothetical protein
VVEIKRLTKDVKRRSGSVLAEVETSSNNNNDVVKVGVGVGVPLGVIILGLVGALFWMIRKQKRTPAAVADWDFQEK